MAFDSANLSLLAYGNGFGLYHYSTTADDIAAVLASGYMNNSDDNLNLAVGDALYVRATDGQMILRVDTVSAAGVVDTEVGHGESQWATVRITDVSTAGSVWIVAPFDGFIRRLKSVLDGAITTADAAVGIELAGVDVTGGQLTIAASGSAAGTVDETVATAANAVAEGDAVEIDTDGGSTVARALTCMVEFVPA